jgi:hypothetical protein
MINPDLTVLATLFVTIDAAYKAIKKLVNRLQLP